MFRQTAFVLFLLTALRGTAFAAPAQWIEVRSSHFTVITDAGDKQARHLLDQFERMRWMFQTLFPKIDVDPVAPIVVVAARSTKDFRELEPADYLGKGQLNLAGLFLRGPDKNYVLLRLDAEFEHPYSAVYHEYTHLQFSSASAWMPIWLNEGVAEFIQNTEIREKDVLLGEPSRDDILYLRQNRIIPLPVLFKVDAKSPYYHEEQKGSVFYAESWALTHYLYINDKQKGTNKVGDYMKLLSQGEDAVTAAEKTFGDLKQLQATLESYIQSSSYKQIMISSAAAPIDESSYKTRSLTGTESDAVRADVLAHVGRLAEARTLLESILAADPKSIEAHEAMGILESRDGHFDAARQNYGEAVHLGSQDYMTYYTYAQMSMGQGIDNELESSLRSAIELNPRFAEAFDLLASLLAQKRENLDEAYKLSQRAIELEPGSLRFRLNLATVLMAMDRNADAESSLRDTLKLTKMPAQAKIVQDRIDLIEQIRAPRAQADSGQPGVVDVIPSGESPGAQPASTVVDIDRGPRHPTEPATGPKHTIEGVIRGVQCSYPAMIEFRVENLKSTASVYSNNYYKLDISAIGLTPAGDLNLCTGIEGMKARVQYAESTDKTADGQIVAIELKK